MNYRLKNQLSDIFNSHKILLAHTNIIYYVCPAIMKTQSKERSKYCNCLYFSSNALARIMTKIADEEFRTTGLTTSYAFLLMTVNEKPGIQPTEISQQMMLTPSTVTRLIDKMENKKYLRREYEGKQAKVFPTEKSLVLDPKLRENWLNLFKKYSDILGENNSVDLTVNISKAVEKLE
jgi:DNA-binding MarR family transcriptional regulator